MDYKSIRIGLIDDNIFMLKSIEEKLSLFDDIYIKSSNIGGTAILQQLEEDYHYDLLLMDIEMPGLSGVETTAIIKQKYPQIKIVMFTVFDNDEHIFKAIQAGADGYLLKDANPEILYKGIKDTLAGGAAMHPSIAMKALKLLRNPQVKFSPQDNININLTAREIDVLEQLGNGLSYTKIAKNLFISPSTVRKHIENIYKKLQVHNKLEAIDLARRQNLI